MRGWFGWQGSLDGVGKVEREGRIATLSCGIEVMRAGLSLQAHIF